MHQEKLKFSPGNHKLHVNNKLRKAIMTHSALKRKANKTTRGYYKV